MLQRAATPASAIAASLPSTGVQIEATRIEKAAFRKITAAIAIASRGVPLAQASAAASASNSASGWVNCPASSPGQVRPPRLPSSLGPVTSSRRAASRPDRPPGVERKSWNS
ncbi:MAG TPA: hypothetical protein VMI73_20880 [Trebonia sp.]|nr:hypothetical protein [Trebonia sp.]